MDIVFVKKIIPVFVFYTEKFLRKNTGAMAITIGPLAIVIIKPKYKDTDEGIHNHEYTHVKQSWRYLWVPFALLYRFSDKHRLQFEAEAYAIQYRSYPDEKRFNMFIDYLHRHYKLPYTRARCAEELLKWIEKS